MNPTMMRELLEVDLENYINVQFPAGSELSPLESERFRQSSFVKSLTQIYLPNEKLLVSLDRHASNTSQTPLVVLGESGIGKSALLANWANRYREQHPEDLMISHWIGCSPDSTSHEKMIRRLMAEIQEELGDWSSPIPQDTAKLFEGFTLVSFHFFLTRSGSTKLWRRTKDIDS